MRVVLDTNVLISALFWKGKAAKILDLAEKGAITICLTKEILDEITHVLDYPKIYKHLCKAHLSVGGRWKKYREKTRRSECVKYSAERRNICLFNSNVLTTKP